MLDQISQGEAMRLPACRVLLDDNTSITSVIIIIIIIFIFIVIITIIIIITSIISTSIIISGIIMNASGERSDARVLAK